MRYMIEASTEDVSYTVSQTPTTCIRPDQKSFGTSSWRFGPLSVKIRRRLAVNSRQAGQPRIVQLVGGSDPGTRGHRSTSQTVMRSYGDGTISCTPWACRSKSHRAVL